MPILKPFLRYYGGKYRAAPRYPKPLHGTIVEPFAGAAGYSLRYPDRQVVLVEVYPVMAEVWRFLISASESDVRRIPYVEHVDDLPDWVPQGGRWLVGFCMNSGTTAPRKQLSSGAKKQQARGLKSEGWSEAKRERVASQLRYIRHWRVIEGDYTLAPDVEATWFIDPPYEGAAGRHYPHGSKQINYPKIGAWCRTRRGQAIVCEAEGAKWLPFVPFGNVKAFGSKAPSREAIWTNIDHDMPATRLS